MDAQQMEPGERDEDGSPPSAPTQTGVEPAVTARGGVIMRDPRVYFAAERTLLAWVRSGLTVMALGFVVARFGLFLALISASNVAASGAHHRHWVSSVVGVGLVVLGAGVVLGALGNHRVYVRSLPPEDLPPLPMPWLATLLAVSVAAVGLLLALYLVVA